MARRRVVIMGAAGRDFHDFNVVYRDDPEYEVVAFTATQIPGIDDRVYPPVLAGPRYPRGIRIRPEAELERERTDAVVLELSGRLEQLPLAVRVAEARTVAGRLVAAGERRITALQVELRAFPVREAAWHAYDPEALSIRDVDRPSDLPAERGRRPEG